MPARGSQALPQFRTVFEFGSKQLTHWFPGHMAKGMREMQRRLADCDCVVEVHDARLPFSGRNPKFDMLQPKPRLLVLNKADLTDSQQLARAVKVLKRSGQHVIPAVCGGRKQEGIRRVLPALLHLVDQTVLQREKPYMRILVAGMPNVGKSTFVNALRRAFTDRGSCAPTGDRPGVTRAVQNDIIVNEDPPIYVLDTPGVMLPKIEDQDLGMKLAMIGTLRDDVVGEELLADYTLFTLNRMRNFHYVDRFNLEGPSDEIDVVLDGIARRIGALGSGGSPSHDRAARHLLLCLRQGKLGKLVLDELPTDPTQL